MKSKTSQLGWTGAGLVLCLFAGGCSGDQLEITPLDEGDLIPEVATAVDEPVHFDGPTEVSETHEQTPTKALTWDVMEKLRFATEGDDSVLFHFQMTNASAESVTIQNINTSCGCTTADTKTLPFILAPSAAENIQIRMSIVGKVGRVTKSIFVQTDCGNSTLLVTSEVIPKTMDEANERESLGEPIASGSREQNLSLAQSDRQAVFKGDCAECHTRYAEERFGYDLYLGACAICHDAEHRASMVPDLRSEHISRDADYWREHITNGIEETLMPAFAKEKNGILSGEQIESLVKFLVESPLKSEAPVR